MDANTDRSCLGDHRPICRILSLSADNLTTCVASTTAATVAVTSATSTASAVSDPTHATNNVQSNISKTNNNQNNNNNHNNNNHNNVSTTSPIHNSIDEPPPYTENNAEIGPIHDGTINIGYPQFTITAIQQNKIVRRLTSVLTHKNLVELEQHITWYLQYLS